MTFTELLNFLEENACVYDYMDDCTVYVKSMKNFKWVIIDILEENENYPHVVVHSHCLTLDIKSPYKKDFIGLDKKLDSLMPDDC